MLNPIALIGTGIIGYYLFNRISNTFQSKLSIQPQNIKFIGVTNGVAQLQLPIDITNNNDVNIRVRSFFGSINYGQIKIANIQKSLSFVVDNNSVTRIYVDLNIPITQVLTDIINQFTLSPQNILTQPILLNGTIEVDIAGVIVPVKINNYQVKLF